MAKQFWKCAAVAVVAGMLAVMPAEATLTFTIDDGNKDLDVKGFKPPFGTVSLSRVDDHNATVTLTALGLYSFGNQTLCLNLAGAGTFSISKLSRTTLGTENKKKTAGAAQVSDYQVESGNISEWGKYNFILKTTRGFNDPVTSLTFKLTTEDKHGWASEAEILTPNNKGYAVAGHVFTRLTNGENADTTGFSAASPVPEPTTMIAGALLLLPFAASTMRMIRKNRA